jgi:large subunit ribosomal protein L3
VDPELNLLAIRGAIPGPKGGTVIIRSTSKTIIEAKGPAAGISVNPQKASARVNPQKASARNK